MSNIIGITGKLGKDCVTRNVGDKTATEFSVADSIYMGKGKEKETNWHKVTLWGAYGEALEPYLKKGQEVFVRGELLLRKYTTKEGVEGSSMEIRNAQVSLIGGKKDGDSSEAPAEAPAQSRPATGNDMDELPF